jgi:hypothetical protein
MIEDLSKRKGEINGTHTYLKYAFVQVLHESLVCDEKDVEGLRWTQASRAMQILYHDINRMRKKNEKIVLMILCHTIIQQSR